MIQDEYKTSCSYFKNKAMFLEMIKEGSHTNEMTDKIIDDLQTSVPEDRNLFGFPKFQFSGVAWVQVDEAWGHLFIRPVGEALSEIVEIDHGSVEVNGECWIYLGRRTKGVIMEMLRVFEL